MTPQEAYNNIKQVVEAYKGTWQDHLVLQQCLGILKPKGGKKDGTVQDRKD